MMKLSILLLCSFLLTNVAQAQLSVTFDSTTGNYIIRFPGEAGTVQVVFEPPTNIIPSVEARVSQEPSGELTYHYRIRNSSHSRQRLFSFSVEHYSTVSSLLKPNPQWTVYPFSTNPIVNWAHTLADPSGAKSRLSGVAPDSALGGFSFLSNGLPAILACYFQGTARTLSFPEEPPGEIDSVLDPLLTFPGNSVRRSTIGPRDVASPFVASSFLDTLISYKHQAFALGWIDSTGVVNSLDQKLNTARRQILRGNTDVARNMLRAFVNEVEAQNGHHLTSEAYALLKFNAEYLIARL